MIKVRVSRLQNLPEVLIISAPVYTDQRGKNVVLWQEEEFKKIGIKVRFVQDNLSLSRQNVLRGIHGDNFTWKLVSCLYGEIFLAVVCCDRSSNLFGRWEGMRLSQKCLIKEKERKAVLIPPKYGNGHLVLSKQAVFHYKLSQKYDLNSQFSYSWDDPRFNISWPLKSPPLLSKRDKAR